MYKNAIFVQTKNFSPFDFSNFST